jgi:hypothetical protein
MRDSGRMIPHLANVTSARIRSHDESASKQRRLRSVWKAKREGAAVDQTPLSRVSPAWLTLSEDRKTWIVDDEKADVVRRIYRMFDTGIGQRKIAETLNRDAVPMFGRWMKDGSRRPGGIGTGPMCRGCLRTLRSSGP